MNPYAEALAWALVHFVWQGAALALLAFLAIRWLRPSAEARYVVGIATLAAMLASPVVTFAVLSRSAATSPPPAASTPASPSVDHTSLKPAADPAGPPTPGMRSSSRATLVLLAAWLCGVSLLTTRLIGGWVVARRMVTRGVRPVAPEIAMLARRVAARLALERAVHVIESSAVSVPVMVGWLKPIVLLPAVALSGLTPTQLEALIAHELAHVRRHDYLVNLLQAAVETLLFYHPAVWWISKQVRAEREHCCDDLAVGVCDRLVYVSALTDLAAMSVPRTALAATGGSLLTRVQRILSGDTVASTGGVWIPALVVLLVLGAVAPAVSSNAQASAAAVERPSMNVAVIQEVAPAQSSEALAEQSGVAPGVPGGVSAGVPGGVAEQAPQTEAAVRELYARLEQLKQLGDQQLTFDLQRLLNERRKMELDARQQLETAKVQLDSQRKNRDRLRQLYEAGLVTSDTLAAREQQIREIELGMRQIEEQLALRKSDVERAVVEMGARREREQRSSEADLARLYQELQKKAGDKNAKEYSVAQLFDVEMLKQYQMALEQYQSALDPARQRTREELAREQRMRSDVLRREAVTEVPRESRESRLTANTVSVTGATETIRVGDVLLIEISGESELPRAYVVQKDGTVRLPILGSFKVLDLTVQQAGQAVTKQVSRVNSGATVQVSLRRPRGEEPRRR